MKEFRRWHAWMSFGLKLYNPGISLKENEHWLGKYCSPRGMGLNALYTAEAKLGVGSANGVQSDIQGLVSRVAKSWDHKFLNDLEGFSRGCFSFEPLLLHIGDITIQNQPGSDFAWSKVSVQFDRDLVGERLFDGNYRLVCSFRLRGCLDVRSNTPIGFDVLLRVAFQKKWEEGEDPIVPLGLLSKTVGQWREILQTHTCKQWLGVTSLEDLCQRLYEEWTLTTDAIESVELELDTEQSLVFRGH